MLAGLLRLAASDIDDARLLLQRGRMRNAGTLSGAAASRLLQAVQTAGSGRWDPTALPSAKALDTSNPYRARLLAMADAAPPTAPQRDGGPAPTPGRSAVQARIDEIGSLLDDLVSLFAVDLRGDEPAGRISLLLPPPPPAEAHAPATIAPSRWTPDPAPEPEPIPATPITRPTISVAQQASSGSSASFWALMDKWQVADLDALDLLGHAGGLTKKGTRPRFRLSPPEAARLAGLHELDDRLGMLQISAREWLRKPLEAAPFDGSTPFALMQQERATGLDTLRRTVVRLGMQASLGSR